MKTQLCGQHQHNYITRRRAVSIKSETLVTTEVNAYK